MTHLNRIIDVVPSEVMEHFELTVSRNSLRNKLLIPLHDNQGNRAFIMEAKINPQCILRDKQIRRDRLAVNECLFVFAHPMQDSGLAVAENAEVGILCGEFHFVRFTGTAIGKQGGFHIQSSSVYFFGAGLGLSPSKSKNSLSEITFTPSSFALSNFEPASSPAKR